MTEDIAPPWKGLRTDRMPRFISYAEAERIIASMFDDVAAWRPDAVVAIVRGGLVPATMAACMLGLPLFMVGWDRATGRTGWIGPAPAPAAKRLLLVDDCCATGRTMASVRSSLLAEAYDCATLTLTFDPDTTCYVPDHGQPMRQLFRFPWERGEATPAARRLRALGGPSDRTTELPFFGVGLDNLVPSPPPELPRFPRERAVVISGQAESHRATIEASLALWGLRDLPLECRPDAEPDGIESIARHKAMTATRWGCTHVIESDPEQAIRIAAAAPHLVVAWWSPGDSRTWTIDATAQPDVR